MATQRSALRWLLRAEQGIASRARDAAGPPRLGVLSAVFNPPTWAHLALAGCAVGQLALDEVLFVLPEVPPHKERLEASLSDRAEMLRRAVAGQAKFSTARVTHGLFLDIHRALAPHYPAETRVIFLTGRDAAQRILFEWPYADLAAALREMFVRFEFAVAARGGEFRVPPGSAAAPYTERIHALRLPAESDAISATAARERIARGESVSDMVPDAVEAYIAARGLYRRTGTG